MEDYVKNYIDESIECEPAIELLPIATNEHYTCYEVASNTEINGCPVELVKRVFPDIDIEFKETASYFVEFHVLLDADGLLQHLKNKEIEELKRG